MIIAFWTLLVLSLLCSNAGGSRGTTSTIGGRITKGNILFKTESDADDSVDEQLYSRQLYVYGRSAQKRLAQARVLVVGRGPAALEVVKNLALAGVGALDLAVDDMSKKGMKKGGSKRGSQVGINAGILASDDPPNLLGSDASLAHYARRINRHVHVSTIEAEAGLKKGGYDVVVSCGATLAENERINQCSRDNASAFVATQVVGVCGYVFADFGDTFTVEDEDGEVYREIPLLSGELMDGDKIRLDSIEEERLDCGLGDEVDVIIAGRGTVTLVVTAVETTHRVVFDFTTASTPSMDAVTLVAEIRNGQARLQRRKRELKVAHHPLGSLLAGRAAPTSFLASGNACLSDREDGALSTTLLAAFCALEGAALPSGVGDELVDEAVVRANAREQLKTALRDMGIDQPLLPPKQGGVGRKAVNFVADHFPMELGSSEAIPGCPATVSILGSIAAQEVIKAISHVHMPLNQMCLFESFLSAASTADRCSERRRREARSSSELGSAEELELIYGRDVCSELANMRIFVAGAGAIGCELLKNFALMGVAAAADGGRTGRGAADQDAAAAAAVAAEDERQGGPVGSRLWGSGGEESRGRILVADMDSIERSNLNRQLLFRSEHVGMSKAVVAAQEIKRVNPRMHTISCTTRLGADTEQVYDGAFWRAADVVVTALDNVDARLFVDAQCVRHGRWLLDSGTLGTKGNTQVIIPHCTESYASSSDPPEVGIPLCTLRTFPYLPTHCIAWGRAIFDESFEALPTALRAVLTVGIQSVNMLSDDEMVALSVLARQLETDGGTVTLEGCVRWGVHYFYKLFYHDLKALLETHPLDEVDDEGRLFWGGSRRVPTPTLVTGPLEEQGRAFVASAALLRARSLGLASVTPEEAQATTDLVLNSGAHLGDDRVVHVDWRPDDPRTLLKRLKRFAQGLQVAPESFEKDDLALGHVDFVHHAANLRACAYDLPVVDRLEVQRVAGQIVPAVATTTSIVAGLVSLELVKIARERVQLKRQGRSPDVSPLEQIITATGHVEKEEEEEEEVRSALRERLLNTFRNAFINVARPMLAFAQPPPADVWVVGGGEGDSDIPDDTGSSSGTKTFTLWDSLIIPGVLDDYSIGTLCDHLYDSLGVDVQTLSSGDRLIFADFLPDAAEREELPLPELLQMLDDETVAMMEDGSLAGDIRDREASTPLPGLLEEAHVRGFLDLEVLASRGGADGSDADDVRLPPVRLFLEEDRGSREVRRDGRQALTAHLRKWFG